MSSLLFVLIIIASYDDEQKTFIRGFLSRTKVINQLFNYYKDVDLLRLVATQPMEREIINQS